MYVALVWYVVSWVSGYYPLMGRYVSDEEKMRFRRVKTHKNFLAPPPRVLGGGAECLSRGGGYFQVLGEICAEKKKIRFPRGKTHKNFPAPPPRVLGGGD